MGHISIEQNDTGHYAIAIHNRFLLWRRVAGTSKTWCTTPVITATVMRTHTLIFTELHTTPLFTEGEACYHFGYSIPCWDTPPLLEWLQWVSILSSYTTSGCFSVQKQPNIALVLLRNYHIASLLCWLVECPNPLISSVEFLDCSNTRGNYTMCSAQ